MNQETIVAVIGISCFAFIVVVFVVWFFGVFKKVLSYFHRIKIHITKGNLWEDKNSDEIKETLELLKAKSDTDPVLIKILEESLASRIKREEKEEQRQKDIEMFGEQDDLLDIILKFLGVVTGLIISTILWGIAILIVNALLTLIIPAVQVSIPFAVIVGFIVAVIRYIKSKIKK